MPQQRGDEAGFDGLGEGVSMRSTVETKIIELVKLGHELASELKASCGAVDVRSVAQLISDLAAQLDVQFARSNALAAKLSMINGLMLAQEATEKLAQARDALAAENAGLNKFIAESCFVQAGEVPSWHQAIDHAPETTATSAFLAEVRAQGVDVAIEHLHKKFEGTGQIGVPVIALEWLAQELRKGAAQ